MGVPSRVTGRCCGPVCHEFFRRHPTNPPVLSLDSCSAPRQLPALGCNSFGLFLRAAPKALSACIRLHQKTTSGLLLSKLGLAPHSTFNTQCNHRQYFCNALFIHIRHMTPSATIVFVHLINMEDVRFSHGLDVHHRRTGEKMMGIILSTHQPVPE